MNQTLAEQAFLALYPDKHVPTLVVTFSGKFTDYNGNVRISKAFRTITKLEFSLSKKFCETEDDITIGIIQHLLNKTYKTKIQTIEQEFYHNFIKHLNKYIKRKTSDPYLSSLFKELNEEYFNELLDEPNLVFGQNATTTLGHYQYSTDTVTISRALVDNEALLKYVLYHELLHKKHSFTTKNGRASYHTKAFRDDEKKFSLPQADKQLEQFIRAKKIKNLFSCKSA